MLYSRLIQDHLNDPYAIDIEALKLEMQIFVFRVFVEGPALSDASLAVNSMILVHYDWHYSSQSCHWWTLLNISLKELQYFQFVKCFVAKVRFVTNFHFSSVFNKLQAATLYTATFKGFESLQLIWKGQKSHVFNLELQFQLKHMYLGILAAGF